MEGPSELWGGKEHEGIPKDGVNPPSPDPSKGSIKGAKGWSEPPQLFADPGDPAGNSQEMPELTHRGKGQERTRRQHGRRTESFRRRDRDTLGANPQLFPFSIPPPRPPDSSLPPRSRSGSTHSLAEYTDKAQELWMQELQKHFWLMGTPKFLPRAVGASHGSPSAPGAAAGAGL